MSTLINVYNVSFNASGENKELECLINIITYLIARMHFSESRSETIETAFFAFSLPPLSFAYVYIQHMYKLHSVFNEKEIPQTG